MKIALIRGLELDYALLEDRLKERGHSVDTAETLPEFESNHGSLYEYDRLLAHPGVNKQSEFVTQVRKKYPSLKIAFVTRNLGDYVKGDTPVFDADDIDGIELFLQGKL